MVRKFAERFFRTVAGLALYFRDYSPVGAEKGVPVVCVHGLTRNSADFENVASFIASMGRRVIAVDVRGRGRSDRDARPENYRFDVYAQDIADILNDLQIRRVVLIGTSMGGLVAMVLNGLRPELIAGLVLNDVGPVPNPVGRARLAGHVGKTIEFESWKEVAQAQRARNSVAFPGADDSFWQTLARRTARKDVDGKIRFDYDPAVTRELSTPAAVAAPDFVACFAKLSGVPLLVVRGQISDILTAMDVEIMRGSHSDLECVEIAGVGHAPTLDEPAARDALAGFLRRVE